MRYYCLIILVLFSYFNNVFIGINAKTSTNIEQLNDKKSFNQYLLGAGDVLDITIENLEEISGVYKILNDGSIFIPLIGSINLNNLSLEEAQKKIKVQLEKELISPIVYMRITTTRPVKVTVIGEINKAGVYTLNTEKSLEPGEVDIENPGMSTVSTAIQKAGGITPETDLSRIILKRRLSGEDETYKNIELNFLDLFLKGDQLQNPILYDGDVVKLIKADKNNQNIIKPYSLNLNPSEIRINVIGAVNNPGLITVQSNTTLNQALLFAGGPTSWKANTGNVRLVRINPNGTASHKKYKINLNADVSGKKNPNLISGDTIYVYRTLIGKTIDGLSMIANPFKDGLTIYTLLKILD